MVKPELWENQKEERKRWKRAVPPVRGTTDFRGCASTAYQNTERISRTQRTLVMNGKKG